MIEITYTNLEFPFSKPFSVKGLPPLKNGEPTQVTDEQANNFKSLTGKTIHQAFSTRKDFTVRSVTTKSTTAGGE